MFRICRLKRVFEGHLGWELGLSKDFILTEGGSKL